MSLQAVDLWPKVQEEIASRLQSEQNETAFRQWFSIAELTAVAGEEGQFSLGVPNRFYKARIEKAYSEVLRLAVEAVTGQPARVTVQVSPRLYETFRKEQKEQEERLKEEADLPPLLSIAPEEGVWHSTPKRGFLPGGRKLNPEFTFATFVTSPANHLAQAVALRVVDQPGQEYNPLLFYGPPGVGKTHLLQAVCQALLEKRPESRVAYVTAERFLNDFVLATQSGAMGEFRSFYHQLDALALDDIQDLGLGKREKTQSELLNLIDELAASGRQVVFGASRSPAELDGVMPKLRDRLASGFVDRLQLPDEETRRQLLRRKMAERGLDIPDSFVTLLAQELTGNVRHLEGMVTRLAALIKLKQMPVNAHLIRLVLEISAPLRQEGNLTIASVIQAVADEFGLSPEILSGKGRRREQSRARQIAMALCRYLLGAKHAEIGLAFGGRSHATVISALKTLPESVFSDPGENQPVERIVLRLGLTGITPADIIRRQNHPRLFNPSH